MQIEIQQPLGREHPIGWDIAHIQDNHIDNITQPILTTTFKGGICVPT